MWGIKFRSQDIGNEIKDRATSRGLTLDDLASKVQARLGWKSAQGARNYVNNIYRGVLAGTSSSKSFPELRRFQLAELLGILNVEASDRLVHDIKKLDSEFVYPRVGTEVRWHTTGGAHSPNATDIIDGIRKLPSTNRAKALVEMYAVIQKYSSSDN